MTTVKDVSFGDVTGGWLYGFDINHHELKEAHKDWLNARVVSPLALYAASNGFMRSINSPEWWHVWLVGAASRTGSYRHNLKLSERRANSIREFLRTRLGAPGATWTMSVHPFSETPAAMLGRADEVENLFDRAVLVLMRKFKTAFIPDPPLPSIPSLKPELPMPVSFYFASRRGSWFNVNKWRAELYASYRHKGRLSYDGWQVSASSVSIAVTDVNKAWTPALPSVDAVLAGPTEAHFPSVDALDGLNGKRISLGTRGNELVLRVESAMPDGRDLHLRFPSTTSGELSQGVGSLGKRMALPEHLRKNFENDFRAASGQPMFA